MVSAESTPSLGRQPRNTFENKGNVSNQAGQQNISGNVNFYSSRLEDDSHPLKLLPYAAQAAFNSSDKQHARLCLTGTRVDILAQIRKWADGHHEKCIFWLNGMAGTGKSTIALTVAREYDQKGRLGASFFFSRGGGDLGSSSKVFTTLVTQLADKSPVLKRYICEAVVENADIGNKGLYDQWNKLVLQPLSRLNKSLFPLPLIILLDALDECEGEDDVRLVLQLLAKAKDLRNIQLRIFVTSRPETPIRYGINNIPKTTHQDIILHKVPQPIIEDDLLIFFKENLDTMRRNYHFVTGWPGEETIQLLVKRAGGLFIYAATACRFLEEDGRRTEARLNLILRGDDTALPPEKKLDEIYTTVLTHSFDGEHYPQENKDLRTQFNQVVGSIVVLLDTLSATSLAGLLKIQKDQIDRTLIHLHSVLDVPKNQDGSIRLLHPSFRDFLLDKQRCSKPQFFINEEEAHHYLFTNCLSIMSNYLRRDMCDIQLPGALAADLNRSEVNQHIPPHVQYACRYWVYHLQRSKFIPCDNDDVHIFLQTHFLYWLETLAVMRCMSEGVVMVKILDLMLTAGGKVELALSSGFRSKAGLSFPLRLKWKKNPNLQRKLKQEAYSTLQAFVHDTKLFILNNGSIIEKAPLQIYYSALVFAPETSLVRKQFEGHMHGWITRLPKVQKEWSSLLQTLEGHSDWVRAVAFSPDGKLVASASNDRTVRLWDAATGAARQTLKGHSGSVRAVAFSPDGKLVASASDDRTVRLWDAATGAARQMLEGHGIIRNLLFSSDGLYLETERGKLDISSLSSNISLHPSSVGDLFVKETWVTYKMENVLWLPFEYRATCSAVRSNLLVLGHASGRVTFFEFNLPNIPLSVGF